MRLYDASVPEDSPVCVSEFVSEFDGDVLTLHVAQLVLSRLTSL